MQLQSFVGVLDTLSSHLTRQQLQNTLWKIGLNMQKHWYGPFLLMLSGLMHFNSLSVLAGNSILINIFDAILKPVMPILKK